MSLGLGGTGFLTLHPGLRGPTPGQRALVVPAHGGGAGDGAQPRATVVTVVLPTQPHRRGLRGRVAAPTGGPRR